MIDIGKLLNDRLSNEEMRTATLVAIAEQLKRIADVQESKLAILKAKGE